MAFNAVLGTQNFTEKQIIDGTHQGIIKSMALKADNGELVAGLLVAKDNNGDIVAYDPGGVSPVDTVVGVLVTKADTTKETNGRVLKHGTVVRAQLTVDDGTPAAPDDADIANLEAIGIYAI